jgi:hypothetical protein
MPGFFLGPLAALHLENIDFRSLCLVHNFTDDLRPFDKGPADPDIRFIDDHQDLIENNLCTAVAGDLFYGQHFSRDDPVLLPACFYDCVHDPILYENF